LSSKWRFEMKVFHGSYMLEMLKIYEMLKLELKIV